MQHSFNTVKLLLNWFLWGGLFGWIPSIIDTVNYISYEALITLKDK